MKHFSSIFPRFIVNQAPSNKFNYLVQKNFLSTDFLTFNDVETVGDLKTKLGENKNFNDHEDFDKWKLFLFGIELDDPTVRLAELDTTGTNIVLTAPLDIERGGRRGLVNVNKVISH